MGRECEICNRGTSVGQIVPRKGLIKKKGGTGSKMGIKTKRTFKINIQNKKMTINGIKRYYKICTRCIKTLSRVN